MDMRGEFEAFIFSERGCELHGMINTSDMSACAFAWEIWQACANHYEAELNSLLAVIQKQIEALVDVNDELRTANYRGDLQETITDALALAPENCKLVEVGEVTNITYEDKTEQDIKINYLFENVGTKLYAIEVQNGN